MGKLSGKVAIVTGGGSGIGKAIAKAYADEGCAVVIAGRQAERLNKAAQELSQSGSAVVAVPTDVTDEAQVKALFQKAMDQFGKLDILVNASGAFDGGPIDKISLAAWNNVVGANLTGPFLCCREAFAIMKKQGGGRIINIGSISAQRARENSAPYTATKFAMEGLTQSLALDGREFGIVASCLHPGNVLVERRMKPDGTPAVDEPMMEPADIAQPALLMATLPPYVNMLSAIVLPNTQLYVGRG